MSMSISSFSIGSVVLIRIKKLKGGKTATRNVRIINKGIKTTVIGEGPVKKIQATIDHKHVQATLDGWMDTTTSTVQIDVTNCTLSGYMKYRKFYIAGHMPRATFTNLNARAKKNEPEGIRSKVSAPRAPHVSGRKRSKF